VLNDEVKFGISSSDIEEETLNNPIQVCDLAHGHLLVRFIKSRLILFGQGGFEVFLKFIGNLVDDLIEVMSVNRVRVKILENVKDLQMLNYLKLCIFLQARRFSPFYTRPPGWLRNSIN
jgi:hypothetical protein